MEELNDYSGKYIPNVKIQDFSKDALWRLWKAGGKEVLGLDGCWNTCVKEKFGEEVARELECAAWRKFLPMLVKFVTNAMNIKGNDVEAFFKCVQVDPQGTGIMDHELVLKDKNHGIWSVTRCDALDYFERNNHDPERIKFYCQEMDHEAILNYAHCFNPKIKVHPVFTPPRTPEQKKGRLACEWNIILEE